jgi:hypothetical protein
MTDIIVYELWTKGGGVDGMDFKDKPKLKSVFLDRTEAEKKVDGWHELKVKVIENVEAERVKALERINPLDLFLLTKIAPLNVTRIAPLNVTRGTTREVWVNSDDIQEGNRG